MTSTRSASWTPGAKGPSAALPARVLRALNGGTLTRIYPDGKTESIVWKTGEVKYFDATPEYAVKNTGKHAVPGHFLVNVRDGKVAFKSLGRLSPGTEEKIDLQPSIHSPVVRDDASRRKPALSLWRT